MQNNNWYIITGGPSTGKTALLAELEKLGYQTVPEAARTLIDKAVAKGISAIELRADEKLFQEEVLRLKQKIEAEHDNNELTFFDRGMHDSLAYMKYYGFKIENWIDNLMRQSSYRKVFLLEPLATYQQDYARTETKDFSKKIQKLLHEVYGEFAMKPVSISAGSLKKRTQLVLNNLDRKQSL